MKPGDDEETVKRKVEKEVRRHSERWEWHDDGSLSVTHIVPCKFLPPLLPNPLCKWGGLFTDVAVGTIVIRKHVETGKTTFFGNLTSAFGRSKFHGATEPPFLGDDGGVSLPYPLYLVGKKLLIQSKSITLSQPTETAHLFLLIISRKRFRLRKRGKF